VASDEDIGEHANAALRDWLASRGAPGAT